MLLAVTHTSIEDAQDYGWLKLPHAAAADDDDDDGSGSGSSRGSDGRTQSGAVDEEWAGLVAPWQAFYTGTIQWRVLPSLIPTWFAMYDLRLCYSWRSYLFLQQECSRILL